MKLDFPWRDDRKRQYCIEAGAARRELLEETGWNAPRIEHVASG